MSREETAQSPRSDAAILPESPSIYYANAGVASNPVTWLSLLWFDPAVAERLRDELPTLHHFNENTKKMKNESVATCILLLTHPLPSFVFSSFRAFVLLFGLDSPSRARLSGK